jgi:acetyltransferase-like isoleucine patch superfamily enzyme
LVILDLTADVVVEKDATVSMGVVLLTHQDVGDRPLQERYPRKVRRTVIGEGCYIGASVTILAGCDIGARAIVAAGAVVTQSVPEGAFVAGVPAAPKRQP